MIAYSSYKGQPTITLTNDRHKSGLDFDLTNAQLILAHIDDIRTWVSQNSRPSEPTRPTPDRQTLASLPLAGATLLNLNSVKQLPAGKATAADANTPQPPQPATQAPLGQQIFDTLLRSQNTTTTQKKGSTEQTAYVSNVRYSTFCTLRQHALNLGGSERKLANNITINWHDAGTTYTFMYLNKLQAARLTKTTISAATRPARRSKASRSAPQQPTSPGTPGAPPAVYIGKTQVRKAEIHVSWLGSDSVTPYYFDLKLTGTLPDHSSSEPLYHRLTSDRVQLFALYGRESRHCDTISLSEWSRWTDTLPVLASPYTGNGIQITPELGQTAHDWIAHRQVSPTTLSPTSLPTTPSASGNHHPLSANLSPTSQKPQGPRISSASELAPISTNPQLCHIPSPAELAQRVPTQSDNENSADLPARASTHLQGPQPEPTPIPCAVCGKPVEHPVEGDEPVCLNCIDVLMGRSVPQYQRMLASIDAAEQAKPKPQPTPGANTIQVTRRKSKRYVHGYGEEKTDMYAEVERNKSIRIFGRYSGNTYFDKTFKMGDQAEYHSYNLTYTGKIIQISDKCITVRTSSSTTRRLDLHTFCWRNHDFDLQAIADRNARWSD